MPFATAGLNKMLDGLEVATSLIGFASLHTAYSATGTNELTGGSPAYARKAVTWAAASGGSKAMNGTFPTFDIPPSTTVAFVGLWTASTAGTFAGMGANGGATQFAGTGIASTDTFTALGTSYAVNDTLVFFSGVGNTMPTGITAGTIYFVKTAPGGGAYTLSTTAGGTTLDITADGTAIVQKITTEVFNAQGTFTVSADTLTVV